MSEMCWIRGCPKRPVWQIRAVRDGQPGRMVEFGSCEEHAPFALKYLEGVNEPTTTPSEQ